MKTHFEGLYYKNQNHGQTLALIPGCSKESAFIQVITNYRSYNIDYDLEEYSLKEYSTGDIIQVGKSVFKRDQINIDIDSEELKLKGQLTYTDLTPLKSDIMGPFRFFPMECRHQVVSMYHNISGQVTLNDEQIDFDGGIGYIEGDSGRSFPETYTWLHSNEFDEKCSVLVSIAKIPFMGFHFNGCICAIWYGGKEYRLATYHRVKVISNTKNKIELEQGAMRLIVDIEDNKGHELFAPQHGQMSRIILERLSVKARFRFYVNEEILFYKSSEHATFEKV